MVKRQNADAQRCPEGTVPDGLVQKGRSPTDGYATCTNSVPAVS